MIINKKFCLCFFAVIIFIMPVFSERSYGQEIETKNAIYGQCFGYALFGSIGYERLFTDWFGLNIAVGGVPFAGTYNEEPAVIIPAYLSVYPIGHEHRFYIDAGVDLFTGAETFVHDEGTTVVPIFGLGYNYHPANGRFYLKTGPSLFIGAGKKVYFFFGVAFGRCF